MVADFTKTGSDDGYTLHTGFAALFDGAQNQVSRDGNYCKIDLAIEFKDTLISGKTLDFRFLRVDREDVALVLAVLQCFDY